MSTEILAVYFVASLALMAVIITNWITRDRLSALELRSFDAARDIRNLRSDSLVHWHHIRDKRDADKTAAIAECKRLGIKLKEEKPCPVTE